MFELERVSIRLVEDPPLYSETPVHSPQDAVDLIREEMQQYDREVVCVLNLGTKGKVINMNVASVGTLCNAMVNPSEVYKSAILSNAADIILFHNHPSGDPTPSMEDIEITVRMKKSGQLLGIRLLDHIIVGHGDDYFSFMQNGQCYLEDEDKDRDREFDKLVTTEESPAREKQEPFREEKEQRESQPKRQARGR